MPSSLPTALYMSGKNNFVGRANIKGCTNGIAMTGEGQTVGFANIGINCDPTPKDN